MIRRSFRLLRIQWIIGRYLFNRQVISQQLGPLYTLTRFNPLSWGYTRTRGESLRIAMEKLGPIFIKFGQVLSTRRDLLPNDIADELANLQDNVPPFASKTVEKILRAQFKKPAANVFKDFDAKPLASASIAQVHAATLHTGEKVILKIIRPNIKPVIERDLDWMFSLARLLQRAWTHGKRLRLVDVVEEFEHTIHDELDLMREAANASLLRRNFIDSDMMYVPKIYWDYCSTNVMVMERIYGVRISEVALLKQKQVDLKKLAEHGVEIFFTQVFRDSFFHADMHPGNVFVNIEDPANPIYCAVDFGIMGSLNPEDQRYLAENFLAFFNRDYREVARLHIESGWVPADTRVDQLEAGIRTVCEPIFEKPLNEISFAQLLLRLFQTAKRFNMEVQPQLLLLQKTLLNIEGLGRDLYPNLNLWETAKPFLEKWMRERLGPLSLMRRMIKDFPVTSNKLAQLPSLIFEALSDHVAEKRSTKSADSFNSTNTSRKSFWPFVAGFISGGAIAAVSYYFLLLH